MSIKLEGYRSSCGSSSEDSVQLEDADVVNAAPPAAVIISNVGVATDTVIAGTESSNDAPFTASQADVVKQAAEESYAFLQLLHLLREFSLPLG